MVANNFNFQTRYNTQQKDTRIKKPRELIFVKADPCGSLICLGAKGLDFAMSNGL